jgi:hypothetical protein
LFIFLFELFKSTVFWTMFLHVLWKMVPCSRYVFINDELVKLVKNTFSDDEDYADSA